MYALFQKTQIVYVDVSLQGLVVAVFPHEVFWSQVGRSSNPDKAEFKGIKFALEKMTPHQRYVLYSDSQKAITMLTDFGVSKRNGYAKVIQRIIRQKMLNVEFKWIPREKNEAGRIIESVKSGQPGWRSLRL